LFRYAVRFLLIRITWFTDRELCLQTNTPSTQQLLFLTLLAFSRETSRSTTGALALEKAG
jgi:hypothetical protein